MTSERVQRQIDRLLDEAEAAITSLAWETVRDRAIAALALDEGNADATSYLSSAERALSSTINTAPQPGSRHSSDAAPPAQPTSFANGRYQVKRFLGEGGKKKVYLAHDAQLDRDVAFALIKTEGLDEAGRVRIQREAQAMGRLGNHPNIVTVYDIGDESGQPFLVLPILSGGDVEGVVEKAPEHKLPLEQAIRIAIETCQGLELAHSKGIVHRDLKPGNVWLTEDGRAMIGDFGLAVAADRSRLTQAGMMVGTVSYMPPEQAMGGEIGPHSDLYSLGAMLYEMVCGRPPFVGDESVAIIGQHLNTPPVSPTWHRPDCPPALEGLILRLLEKDPNKRPASATEVREALQSVATVPRPATLVEPASAGGNDPLYRRTFVGRENEVKQLQAAFDGAMSGNGALVMVVGEPGIGKTALCEQLVTYVALRGGKALVGHCYEEGSLSLPYLAFVEAMRSYVLARDPDGLRSDLGTGAADVARIVSEVRDRVQGVELRPAGDPEDDRWRLLQSVTSFLRNASTVQPLVIVLEDLHWADRGTLDLLLHVSRNLQGARVLIVGTYRDVEVDRSHPLSATVAELRRSGSFLRIPLRGLSVDEVHRMYEALRGQTTPWAQAEAVHRQTEGNPLFVQEVLRYLVEEGFVVRADGRYVPQQGVGAGIPEGLRDVVGKRLSRLSEKTNQVLAIAAVMGRDFRLDVLQIVARLPEEELYTALAEAVERAVVEERSGIGAAVAYRFAHAFFRQTLYEETIAPRRIRLHQQVARALESVYGRRLEEHAAELAEHYSYSSNPEDLKKAVEYGELAAARATSVFDYGEAERHLQQALKVQEVLDLDNKHKRCDLLLALGEAMLPQANPMRIAEAIAPEAYGLAVELDDRQRAAHSALQATASLRRAGQMATPTFREWAQRADLHAQEGTVERVYADIAAATLGMQLSGPAEFHLHLRQALERASALGDNAAFYAAASFGFNLRALRDLQLRGDLAAEVMSRPREGASSADLALCLAGAARILMELGDRASSEGAWGEYVRLAEGSRDASLKVAAQAPAVYFSFMDGRLEDALSGLETMFQAADEGAVGASFVGEQGYRGFLARLRSYLGTTDASLLDGLPTAAMHPRNTVRGLIQAQLGLRGEAFANRKGFGDVGADSDESGAAVLCMLLETSIIIADEDTMSAIVRRLTPLAGRLAEVAPTNGVEISVGRLLGEASILLDRPTEARNFYTQGLEVCGKVGFRPEIALLRLDMAELLLEHYPDERDAAIDHLDFAIAELRDMKMRPALERALRHRGLLKA